MDTQENVNSWEETARDIAAHDTRYLGIQDEIDREGIKASLNYTESKTEEKTSRKK